MNKSKSFCQELAPSQEAIFKHKISKRPICEIEVTVPEDYDPKNQMFNFIEEYDNDFDFFNEEINDLNFKNIADVLTPGRTYLIKLYKVLDVVKFDLCLKFLHNIKSLMPGPQMGSLLWTYGRNQLPEGKSVLFFSEEVFLFQKKGMCLFPFIHKEDPDIYCFSLKTSTDPIEKDCLLAVVHEKYCFSA